jgi:hypothetical protein
VVPAALCVRNGWKVDIRLGAIIRSARHDASISLRRSVPPFWALPS